MSEPAELLVGDIGGTGTRLARFVDGVQVGDTVCYVNRDHASFSAILEDYRVRGSGVLPARARFAVAGPVTGNRIRMTNLNWVVDGNLLAAEFGFHEVNILNDFAAIAWATLRLTEADFVQIGGGTPAAFANRAVLGPGTGLGVSALVSGPGGWTAVAGEGGHATLPASTPDEAKLILDCFAEYGHCSAERLLCGAGLARMHAALEGQALAPEEVTRRAVAGDAAACRTVEAFSCLLGTVAADVALTFGAGGGVFLAGGILPAIRDVFAASGFRSRFEAKGRFSPWLSEVPVYLIRKPYPSLGGLLVSLEMQ